MKGIIGLWKRGFLARVHDWSKNNGNPAYYRKLQRQAIKTLQKASASKEVSKGKVQR